MKAECPKDGETYFFVDKCMPFGAAISCSHFQRFSNALSHITKFKTGSDNVNYLDNFFFVALLAVLCNLQLSVFTKICDAINFPWSTEKTVQASTRITFLGLLIDTLAQKIFIPIEKVKKALATINKLLGRKNKKATIGEIQHITGLLNFFSKCIVPGRTFTRRMYTLTANKDNLKQCHHVKLRNDTRLDLCLWETFLKHPAAYSRDFSDLDTEFTAQDISMFTDASRNPNLGCGGYCNKDWFVQRWDKNFIIQYQPSIAYLELYAVAIAITLWIKRFKNMKIALFCDNMSVVNMINTKTSKCKNCMILIRLIVIQELIYNVKITAKHVRTEDNQISDALSRMKMKKFSQLTRHKNFETCQTSIPTSLQSLEKLWLK